MVEEFLEKLPEIDTRYEVSCFPFPFRLTTTTHYPLLVMALSCNIVLRPAPAVMQHTQRQLRQIRSGKRMRQQQRLLFRA